MAKVNSLSIKKRIMTVDDRNTRNIEKALFHSYTGVGTHASLPTPSTHTAKNRI